jgi:two-component sensor histidine kinase
VGSFTDGEGHRFFTGVLRDASERATAEARRNILVGELNHRVKNTLASVLAIATQTLRAATSQ